MRENPPAVFWVREGHETACHLCIKILESFSCGGVSTHNITGHHGRENVSGMNASGCHGRKNVSGMNISGRHGTEDV